MRFRRSIPLNVLLTLSTLAVALPAVAQPSFTKAFSPDTIGVGNASRLSFTISNKSGAPVGDLAFVDDLPAGVVLASPPSASTTCGVASVLSAPDGGSTVTFSGGSVGAMSSCSVAVDVVGTVAGSFDNTSGSLTSSAGNSGTAAATLTVASLRLSFAKSFDPDSVQAGATSRLTLDIANPGGPVTDMSFTDLLPSGLQIANPPNAINTCSGTVSAPASGTAITLTSGALPGEGSCSIGVDVSVPVAGSYVNRTGNLDSSSGVAGFAVAQITASVDPLALEKEFVGDPLPPGSTLPLRFTVRNFDRSAATGITFTDDLDTALSGLVALAPLPSSPCGAGSALTGSGLLTLSGGNLAAGESCTFQVLVVIPGGAATGFYINTTSSVSATIGGEPRVGSPATDTLQVADVPVLTKTFLANPVAAGGTVDVEFTLTNSSDHALSGASFFDDSGAFLSGSTAVLPADGFCGGASMAYLDSGVWTFEDLSLDAGAPCTFQMTLQVPVNAAAGTYTNTTSAITGDLDTCDDLCFEPVTGPAASDDLVVVGGPHLTKTFVGDPVLPGDSVVLAFTLTGGEPGAPAIDAIAFTDDLGAVLAGLQATTLPADGFCGPSSHLSGSSVLSVTGASLAGGDSCTFQVTLQVPAGALPGAYTNTTSTVTATSGGLEVETAAASRDLYVAGLSLSKSFTDDPAVAGGTVTLRFTLENVSPTAAVTDATFTDDLDAALAGLAPTGLPQSDVCGMGSQLSAAGNLLTFSGGSLAPSAMCTFSVVLQVPPGTPPGTYDNATSSLTADFDGNPVTVFGGKDTLVVLDPLSIGKDFLDDPVAPGGTATLRFTLANAHPTEAASGLSFTDDLDAVLTGLQAVALPATGFCGAGSTISGSGLLTVTGASLAAASACTFDVTVQVPDAAASGTYVNTTSSLSASGMAVGEPATDTLEVGAAAAIPALSLWGLLALAAMVGLLAWRRLS